MSSNEQQGGAGSEGWLEHLTTLPVSVEAQRAARMSVEDGGEGSGSSLTVVPDQDLGDWNNKIVEGDCLELLECLPTGSVDLLLADLPYGTTQNKWDSIVSLDELWERMLRVTKRDGAIVLTATQPFSSLLVVSQPELFRYEWIWAKTISSGQLNVAHQPLRSHESILVFYREKPTYNPQMTEGVPYTITRKGTNWDGGSYNPQRVHTSINTGTRYPKTVLNVPNPRIKAGHPTQKPVALFEYVIRTYTNIGDTVLDPTIGAGTTAVAAFNTGRRFIGFELESRYVNMSRDNVIAAVEAEQADQELPES